MLYLVLFLIFISSIIAVFARVDERKDNARIENEDLSADDFEILE
jgi:hypothetical protein